MAIVAKAKRQVHARHRARTGSPSSVHVVPASVGKFEMGDIGVLPVMHPEVADGRRTTRRPTKRGLQPGDVVLAAGGERDVTRDRLIELIKANEGKPLPLEISATARPSQSP